MKTKKFKGIATDSRLVKEGFVYVAIKGLRFDGHEYIKEAVRNGAKTVVGERDMKVPQGIKYIKVKDSRDELSKLASDFYGNPSHKLKIIGITGTKGKTTTAHLIYHILTTTGHKAGLVSSIAAKIGNKEIDTGFHVTSPDILSLNKFLKEMVDSGCEYAVIEVSSHGIHQKRVAGVNFEVGVLTNIAPEHLDYHKTFKEYKRVKMSFINSCKYKVISPTETDLAVLPGKFNNLNAEAAVKTAEILGIKKVDAIKSLDSFKLPEGRLEEIANNKGFKIFIDFAHTPESLEAALKYFRTLTSGKLIAVFGAAGERDPHKRPKMGKFAAGIADMVILTAEDPRTEKVLDIISQIKKGIKVTKAVIFEEPDRKKAIFLALNTAKMGDLVAILGKGHEKSMNLDGIYETPWSDRDVVREYIGKLKK